MIFYHCICNIKRVKFYDLSYVEQLVAANEDISINIATFSINVKFFSYLPSFPFCIHMLYIGLLD